MYCISCQKQVLNSLLAKILFSLNSKTFFFFAKTRFSVIAFSRYVASQKTLKSKSALRFEQIHLRYKGEKTKQNYKKN